MSIIKAEEFFGFQIGAETVCKDCITPAEIGELKEEDFIFANTAEISEEDYVFCDRCHTLLNF